MDEKAAKTTKEKLTRKERRRRWKEAKRQKRQELKDYYQYAPWGKRVWNLHLKKPVGVLLVIAILLGIAAVNMTAITNAVVIPLMQASYYSQKDRPLTEEQIGQIYEMSPLDEDGGARIDALPPTGEDETWTICIYIVGSNLEDQDENDLSYVTSMLTKETKQENQQANRQVRVQNLQRYNEELAANGLELPAFFYYPEKPVASSEVVTQDVVVSDMEGAASKDISEMTSGVWSDNIRIVIQTGGATRWSNGMINPNRTQRFEYYKGNFREVENLALQPASDPETLTDFLKFCRDEYPSDHRILVFWNHGGGPFGYGNESITGDMFSLKDIRSSLEMAYEPDRADPAFDIIGFDACLMSTLEVTNTLDGFADYYCLSEEVEPGDGWDYGPWLQAMTENPTMNAAQIGRAIADSYMDFYMRENINEPFQQLDVTFSVIDAAKASELYTAYGDLAKAQLRDAVTDSNVLAEIGRCGMRSTHYAMDHYNVFNTMDLGNYADYMSDNYPEECARIRELIGESVLYHRENGSLSDSTGLAVYLPSQVSDLYGLIYFLDYVYDVCEDESVAALYYYKQAGCLNEELKGYVAELTDAEPQVLDIAPFREFTKAEPGTDAAGFAIPVEDSLQNLMVNYELQIGRFDETANTITYYGQDQYLNLNGEGQLCSEFDGRWICLDGIPLAVNVISSTPAAIEYSAHVLYNGAEASLTITRNRDTDTLAITGLRMAGSDGISEVNNTRSNAEVEPGARIIPLYEQTDYNTKSTQSIKGKQVIMDSRNRVTMEMLPEGYYLMAAVIMDQRGDSYYSAIVGADIAKNGISRWKADTRFYGSDYQ